MKNTFKLSVFTLAVALAGCSSSDDDDTTSGTDEQPVVQGVIKGPLATGSSAEPFRVYFDLDTAAVVDITDEEAKTDTTWDVAFERYKLHLNGNNANNPVSIYNLNTNADFYDADGKAIADSFTNATPDSELQDYLDVTTANIPTDDNMFVADVSEKTIENWYIYGSDHSVAGAESNYFVAKNGEVFSKFSVTSLVLDGYSVTDITLGYYNDLPASDSDTAKDDVANGMQSLELNMANECAGDASHVYVDFVTGSAVASDAAHDLTITCDNNITTMTLDLPAGTTAMQDFQNSVNSAEFAAIYEGYGYFADNFSNTSGYSEVAKGSFSSSFVYGVNGGHTLWSDYNVYVVKSGDKYFKLQFTSYYDENNTSGSISFRADEILAAQ